MSLKKSLLLALLVVLFSVPALWYTVAIPYNSAERFFQQAPAYFETIISETYPHDLEIKVTNGIVSLNRPTPYCLTLDNKTQKGILFDPTFTAEMYKPELISSYPLCSPIIVVGEDTIIHPANNAAGFDITQINPMSNLTLNKKVIDETTKGMLPVILQWGWFIYLFAPVLLIPCVLLLILITNLWYAVINKIIFSLTDKSDYSSLSQSYAISLRFFTLIVMSYSLLMLFNYYTGASIELSFPFLNTIIIAIMSVLWVKYGTPAILSSSTTTESQQVESHALPSPEVTTTGIALSDESKDGTYGFDPTVISTPTKDKPEA